MQIETLKRPDKVYRLIRPEKQGSEISSQDRQTWFAINHFLGNHERYPSESGIAKYTQERLDYLFDGKREEVFVIHDKAPIALAMPGYVLVSDGLFKLFTSQEELDGILAHEQTHITRKHHKKHAKDLLRTIGQRRASEIEADLIPFEFLDKKEVNPLGFITSFRKIEQYTKMKPEETSKWYDNIDIEHGTLLDRRLNIEELVRLVDVRNLSLKTASLPFSSQDYESYQSDDKLWHEYESLDELSKRHFLERQFKQIAKNYQRLEEKPPQTFEEMIEQVVKEPKKVDSKEERDPQWALKLHQLVDWQKELIKSYDSTLSEEDTQTLLIYTLIGGYRAFSDKFSEDVPELNIKNWQHGCASQASAEKLLKSTSHPFFFEMGIDLDTEVLPEYLVPAFKQYIMKTAQTEINIGEYVEFIRSNVKGRAFERLYYEPLIAALVERNEFAQYAKSLADELTDIPTSAANIFGFAVITTTPNSDIEYGMKYIFSPKKTSIGKDENLLAADSLYTRIVGKRFDSIRKVDDPLLIFEHFQLYEDDYPEHTAPDFIVNRRNSMLNSIKNRYDPSAIIDLLNNYVQKTDKKVSDLPFVPLLVKTYADNFSISDGSPINYDNQLYGPKPALTSKDITLDRMSLWAICLSKEEYLAQVKEDIERLVFSKKEYTRETVHALFFAVQEAPKRARKLGFAIDWEITKYDFRHFGKLLEFARDVYLEKAAREKNPEILVKLIDLLPVYATQYSVSDEDSYYKSNLEKEKLQKAWEKLAKLLLENKNLLSSPRSVRQLFALASTTDNAQILLHVVPRSVEVLTKQLPFQDAVSLIFEEYEHMPRNIFFLALDHLIETKARTLDDFERLESLMKREIEEFLDSSDIIGKAAVADSFLDPTKKFSESDRSIGTETNIAYGMQPFRLLKALLSTSENDKELKQYIFDHWWQGYRLGPDELRSIFRIEDIAYLRYPGKEGRLNFWKNEIPPADRYKSFSQAVTDVYMSSLPMRYQALRKILVGEEEEGVLNSRKEKELLIDVFLESRVNFGSNASEQTTRDLMSSLFAVGDQEELYLAFNPILLSMILKFPEHFYPYRKIAEEKAKENLAAMEKKGVLSKPTEKDKAVLTDKILSLMLAGGKEDIQLVLKDADAQILALFPDRNLTHLPQKFSPWELAITVGEKSGAVGVRMLQLAGQYFDIPKDLKERLMDVYDSQKGQSRLQAYRVLMREKERHPEIAKFVDEIAEIHPRKGGGSLVTVYEVLLKDGRQQALAVKNPNAEYHLGKNIDFLKRAIKYAREQHPHDKKYQLLEVLLDDVEEWVLNELADPRFEEKDNMFRLQNDYRYNGGQTKNSTYGLVVPESIPTGTRWIRREEYIEGKNFTSLEVTDDPSDIENGKINKEDYRQAISLLTKNYIHQILISGLVHSDIHPGNFRITSDNKHIAIFDRYNLLELSDQEKNMVQGLMTTFMVGGANGVKQFIAEYVVALEENSSFKDRGQEVLEVLQEINVDSFEKTIMDSIIKLKQKGVKIPLKISLIGKNLQGLNRMAKQAGFSNLIETYLQP